MIVSSLFQKLTISLQSAYVSVYDNIYSNALLPTTADTI